MIKVASEPEIEHEKKNELAEKVERFKAIVEKKNEMVKTEIELKKNLEYEVKMLKEVTEKQINELEEKTKTNENIKKDLNTIQERNLTLLIDQKMMKNEKKAMAKQQIEHEIHLKDLRETNSELVKSNTMQKI